MKIQVLLVILIVSLASCAKVYNQGQYGSENTTNAGMYGQGQYPQYGLGNTIDAEGNQRNSIQYLAYEHELKIRTESSKVPLLHDKVISLCTSAAKGQCILLDANLKSEHDSSAYLKLRLQRDLIKKLVEAMVPDGNVIEQSTHIEDLANSIADNDKRLQLLKSYQEKLIELQKQPNKDVDSLVKIAKEIATVQSNIEQTIAENKYLLNRVNLDILTISITSYYGGKSFWIPISASLSLFSNHLSKGISDVINALAYFLPWLVVSIVLLIVIRKLWRKKKTSGH